MKIRFVTSFKEKARVDIFFLDNFLQFSFDFFDDAHFLQHIIHTHYGLHIGKIGHSDDLFETSSMSLKKILAQIRDFYVFGVDFDFRAKSFYVLRIEEFSIFMFRKRRIDMRNEIILQLFRTFSGRRRDAKNLFFPETFLKFIDDVCSHLDIEQINLGKDNNFFFFGQFLRKKREFIGNIFVILLYSIEPVDIEHMHENFCAFDVFEEFYAESFPLRSSDNESRNILKNECFSLMFQYAKIRDECGKWIVADFGFHVRESRNETRLSRRRNSDNSDIGNEFQFEGDGFFFSSISKFCKFGSLACGSSEVCISVSSASSLTQEIFDSEFTEIDNEFSVFCIFYERSHGNFDDKIFAIGSLHEIGSSFDSILRFDNFFVAKMGKRIEV